MVPVIVRALTVVALALTGVVAGMSEREIQSSVVKIFAVYDEYDFYRPWQMKGKLSKTGSGCIIEGKRVLTNAHVVADQTFIQVERAGRVEKFVATVEFVGHECDLAVLSVPDERFFEGARPIRMGELPRIRDKVAVYGFPTGGTKIAITEGVVSRVENQYYSHSNANLLACQIDAPINPGSSGGPVLSDGKLAGVAFQSMAGENIGYIVPAPVVEHFFADIADGRFDGFPALGLAMQKMENPHIRSASGMSDTQSGILINRAYPRSPCRALLDSGDVILSIDGAAVANDGTVEFRDSERTSYEYVAQKKQLGDSVTLEVLRKGNVQRLRAPLTIASNEWQLVPRQLYDTAPRFYITGGFVFVPLTGNFLRTWGSSWVSSAPRGLTHYYFMEPPSEFDEVVVVGQILTDEVNMGYDDHVYTVVRTVNGKAIRRLEDLVAAVESHDGPWQEFVDEDGYRFVFSTKAAAEHKPRIFQRYHVVLDRSPGLGRDTR